MIELRSADPSEPMCGDQDKAPADAPITPDHNSSCDAEEAESGSGNDKPQTPVKSKSTVRNGYFSEVWSKMSSFTWRRKVSDAASNHEGMENDDVEGVFNAQGLEDEAAEGSGEGTSSTANSNAKRLLYPAGQIFHLVPEYILKSNPTPEAPSDDDTASNEDEPLSSSWYQPHAEHGNEVDNGAFVLFSDMPQEAYGKIRVCRSMVMDHYVPRYKIAVQSAIQDLVSVLDNETTHQI